MDIKTIEEARKILKPYVRQEDGRVHFSDESAAAAEAQGYISGYEKVVRECASIVENYNGLYSDERADLLEAILALLDKGEGK